MSVTSSEVENVDMLHCMYILLEITTLLTLEYTV